MHICPDNGNNSNASIAIRSERTGPNFNEYTANIDIEQFGHLMMDGVGFFFMRYLASICFTGIINTLSMYISGIYVY